MKWMIRPRIHHPGPGIFGRRDQLLSALSLFGDQKYPIAAPLCTLLWVPLRAVSRIYLGDQYHLVPFLLQLTQFPWLPGTILLS